MAGSILTTDSQIQCPHGGQAVLATTNVRSMARSPMLLETDVHLVVGCPFTIGSKYSPCVRIEWSAGAKRVNVNGVAVLTQASMGKCMSAESATQGLALVVSTQQSASAV
ncbi:MAG: hypothetical protein ABJC63_01115 [Gemmatimonadales bacterium]